MKSQKTVDYRNLSQNSQKSSSSNSGKSFAGSKHSNSHNKNFKSRTRATQSSASFFDFVPSWLTSTLLFFFNIFFFWAFPLFFFVRGLLQKFLTWLETRENFLRFGVGVLFIAMVFNFVNLQVYSFDPKRKIQPGGLQVAQVIEAKRGKILFKDLSQNISNLELATNQIKSDISIDPRTLATMIKGGINLEETIQTLSARTNLDYKTLYEDIKTQIQVDNPKNYFKIRDQISTEESQLVRDILVDKEINKMYGYSSWLMVDDSVKRVYPENKLLSQSLGFVLKFKSTEQEARERIGCKDALEQNGTRGTKSGSGYWLGSGGLEQKYCSVLSGLNGKKLANQDLTDQKQNSAGRVVNGGDIYLNIDKNIQKKAESVLEEAVQANTNSLGAPKDGCVMVLEAGSGKIMAMASYPSFDPNLYSEYYQANPKSLVNNCTNNDFEVGSVMKPITVAVALDSYQNGVTESGRRLGVSPSFSFVDYDKEGKPYKDGNEVIKIRNASSFSWKAFGAIGLKEIIRDSINTGIGEITQQTGGANLFNYFENKFRFGQETNVNFLEDSNGDISSFETDVDCTYCWATKGFGQGFSSSMLQLVRGYTALANHGYLVEPKLIDKITCDDGTIETEKTNGSCVSEKNHLNRLESKQILSREAADNVTKYMIAGAEEGFTGEGPTKAMVPNYRVAVKSGTAQISRPIVGSDGKETRCDQTCNTNLGRVDHTFIGYNTGASRYIVAMKLAEPNPGVISNYSSKSLPVHFSNMMKYTLDYMNVPKDR